MLSSEDLADINKTVSQYKAAHALYDDIKTATGITIRTKRYGTHTYILSGDDHIIGEDISGPVAASELDKISDDARTLRAQIAVSCRYLLAQSIGRVLVGLHDTLLGFSVQADPPLPDELRTPCVCAEVPKEKPAKVEAPKKKTLPKLTEAQYKFLSRVHKKGGVYDILGETNSKIRIAARQTCWVLVRKGYLVMGECENTWELTESAVKFLKG